MSTPEQNSAPDDYTARLEAKLAELQESRRLIDLHNLKIGQTSASIHELIREFGVTEDAKFVIAALGGYPDDAEKTRDYTDSLKELDEAIKNSAGQLTAWLTSETEQISHPFNPAYKPETQQSYEFHLGLLPLNASLKVGRRGQLGVPIERSVALPTVGIYQLNGLPSLEIEDGIIPVLSLGEQPLKLEIDPAIDLSRYDKDHPYPVALGDEAVKNLLSQQHIEGHPRINEALDTLTSTLF